jgi:ligand-binding sensor domain-containing protein/DNA-binding CsgD family transcriptional regulator
MDRYGTGFKYNAHSFLKITDDSNIYNMAIINCMASADSIMWIGTNKFGVLKYNHFKEDFVAIKQGALEYSIHALYTDYNQTLWVGSNKGVFVFDADKNALIAVKINVTTTEIVNCFVADKHIGVLAGSDGNGILKYDLNKKEFNKIEIANLPQQIKTFCLTREGKLWVGTWNKGVYVIDPISFTILDHYMASNDSGSVLSSNIITKIIQDSRNNIWIGTINGGLILHNPSENSFSTYKANEYDSFSLPSNSITDVYEDANENIWLASHGGGMSYFNYQTHQFSQYSRIQNEINTLKNNNVTSFSENNDGHVLIGTDGGGVDEFDEYTGGFKTVRSFNTTFGNFILDIKPENSETVWMATWNDGLIRYSTLENRIEAKLHIENKRLNSNNLKSLCNHDSKHGINIYNKLNDIVYNKENQGKFPSELFDIPWCSQVLVDSKNRIWIASYYGLYMFDGENVKSFFAEKSNPNTLSSNNIYTIFEDYQKELWIGSTGGLDKLVEEDSLIKFEQYSQLYHLPLYLKSLINDEFGMFWLGSNEGLVKFDKETNTHNLFTKADGIYMDEFNERACYKTKSNRLYFGGNSGFISFLPSKIQKHSFIQPVVIHDFYLYNNKQTPRKGDLLTKSLAETDNITLEYRHKMIGFGFNSPSFGLDNNVNYQYILEGFEDNWHAIENQTKVTFTNLKPGGYTLKVRAYHNNEDEFTQDALDIVVKPPFWQTWWFIILSIILVSLIVYLLFLYRLRNIRLFNSKLKALVKQKTLQIITEKKKNEAEEKEKHRLILKQKELEADRLEQEKEIIKMKNELLTKELKQKQNDVDRKNAELTSLAMKATSANELISQLNGKLSELENESDTGLQKKIATIKREIDMNLKNQQDWNQFDKLFNEIHDNFLNRLKEQFEDLNAKDLQFCAYLRMNMSSKDIAQLLSISLKGTEKARWRLRKKLDLKSETDLGAFIIRY